MEKAAISSPRGNVSLLKPCNFSRPTAFPPQVGLIKRLMDLSTVLLKEDARMCRRWRDHHVPPATFFFFFSKNFIHLGLALQPSGAAIWRKKKSFFLSMASHPLRFFFFINTFLPAKCWDQNHWNRNAFFFTCSCWNGYEQLGLHYSWKKRRRNGNRHGHCSGLRSRSSLIFRPIFLGGSS